MHAPEENAGSPDERRGRRRLVIGRAPRTRSVLLATGLLVVGVSSYAAAATGDSLREGRRNGTATSETQIISNVASSTGLTGGYSTRQSNLSSSGGGAVYGCRSQAGGSRATPTPQNPCIRANNLSRGLAFEFNSTIGDTAGSITVASGGDTTKPFTTNATGVATGLNADRVDSLNAAQIIALARTQAGLDADTLDGKDSTDLLTRFAQVNADGTVGTTRGTLGTSPVTHATGSYAVAFTGDLSKCSVSATIIGTAFGQIIANTPVVAGANTTITVKTRDATGVDADRAFDLSVNC